jgi:hypothetical protein
MTFNPHKCVTADGAEIELGLAVFTNELEVGEVVGERVNQCCGCDDTAVRGQMYVPGSGWFSDHKGANKMVEAGHYCRHDHWFEVDTGHGVKSFNGERLATLFEGRSAAKEWSK